MFLLSESRERPMVDRFVSYRTCAAARAGEPGAVIRHDPRAGGEEMVNLIWGFAPAEPGRKPFTVYRSEGRRFGSRRCLIPAAQFTVAKGHGKERRKWAVSLRNGDWFYFAGIWRPAEAGWPPSYAILTCAANPEVQPYHDRQMVVIRRADRRGWLDHHEPEAELLKPLPGGSFELRQIDGPALQDDLGLAAA